MLTKSFFNILKNKTPQSGDERSLLYKNDDLIIKISIEYSDSDLKFELKNPTDRTIYDIASFCYHDSKYKYYKITINDLCYIIDLTPEETALADLLFIKAHQKYQKTLINKVIDWSNTQEKNEEDPADKLLDE